MEWMFCPERYCATEAWLVRQALGNAELWSLECRLTGASFTVAASDPVCPRCGSGKPEYVVASGAGTVHS